MSLPPFIVAKHHTYVGLLTNDKVPRVPFGFFDPGVVGLPAGIILILYMIFAGPYILPHHKDEEPASFAREQNQLIEVKYVEEDVSKSGMENATLVTLHGYA